MQNKESYMTNMVKKALKMENINNKNNLIKVEEIGMICLINNLDNNIILIFFLSLM